MNIKITANVPCLNYYYYYYTHT